MVAGRPPKPIDWKIFEQLCHIQCTHSEIASFFHVVVDTLYDRVEKEYGEKISSIYKRFSEGGKSSLRRHQFRMAEKNCSMAIWLGKQYLGQRDHDDERDKKPPHDDKIDAENNQMSENARLRKELAKAQATIDNLTKARSEL